ncbi:MAG: hypothetical protein HY508_07950 [Acidobacteria bacterium]|nr:hypothetical protein [Acidobacteriota bacterium]
MRRNAIEFRRVLTPVFLALVLTTFGWEAAGQTPNHPAGDGGKAQTGQHQAASKQNSGDTSGSPASVKAEKDQAEEIQVLKELLAAQQKQIEQLRVALEEQRQTIEHALQAKQDQEPQAPSLGQVASNDPVIPKSATRVENSPGPKAALPVAAAPAAAAEKGTDEVSPLQFHIGTATIMPVGFMDFTTVFRNHTGGSGIGTNFGSIPYGSTTFQGNLSEFRLSMQNSRIGFRVDGDVKGAHVIGYMESDFLGNNPGNVAVSSNSNTLRSRLYWLDVKRSKWEILGGQTWSLLTPGRSGISPLPGDLFFTQNIDVNYQVGLAWGRIPEFRFVYHPTSKVAFAVAASSPEQYIGGSAGGGKVTFPAAVSSTYTAGELNDGSTTLGVPNVAPDVIAKLAVDPSKKFHFELGGIMRNFKLWNPTDGTKHTAIGGGGFVNLNLELFKGFRLMTHNFWSDGGGRYIFGQAPDLISRVDGSPSLIHSSSTVTGLEYTHKNWLIYSYYGGVYVGRNVTIDTNGKPVGYGYSGSSTGQNRAIQEATFGLNQTIWKEAKWGAVNFMAQYSYLTRNPWSVATGQPANANMHMVFLNLRYSLPGSAPAAKK